MELPAEMEKQTGGFSGEKSIVISNNEKAAVDLFYEKLGKLNESSGLSLLFNFRQTMLDLHRFYKEVIERGGFYQVTKKGKWDDVASISNSKSRVYMSASQLRNVYEMLILQYELMYSHKMPDRANIWPAKSSLGYFGSGVNPSFSTGKRKHCDGSSPISILHPGDDRAYTWKEAKGAETVHKNPTVTISPNSNVKEFVADDSNAPQKPRTGYQIFLRLETNRLKMMLGESSSTQNLRELATAAWRRLREQDKLPYIEASKMDRERYDEETAAYKKLHENQNGKSQTLFSSTTPSMLNFSMPKEAEDVYHVSLEDGSEDLHSPDESVIELAIEAMKKAKSNDSIFQLDWDNNGPPNRPTS